jgi:hypothetical protein
MDPNPNEIEKEPEKNALRCKNDGAIKIAGDGIRPDQHDLNGQMKGGDENKNQSASPPGLYFRVVAFPQGTCFRHHGRISYGSERAGATLPDLEKGTADCSSGRVY